MESGLPIREDKFFFEGAQKKTGRVPFNFEWREGGFPFLYHKITSIDYQFPRLGELAEWPRLRRRL